MDQGAIDQVKNGGLDFIAGLEGDAYLAAVGEIMERHVPFNAFLGLVAEEVTSRGAVVRMPFRPELVGDPTRPALHGGTLSMLVDTAGGTAVFAAAKPGSRVSTIDIRVDYLRPAALVDSIAEARVVRIGGQVAVARIQVWQPVDPTNASSEACEGEGKEKRLVAEGTGVYAVRAPRTERSDPDGSES